jgi:hypothetical protein
LIAKAFQNRVDDDLEKIPFPSHAALSTSLLEDLVMNSSIVWQTHAENEPRAVALIVALCA